MHEIKLQGVEESLLVAASNVFSGLVSDGKIDSNEKTEKAINYSIFVAMKMAVKIKNEMAGDNIQLGGNDDPGPFPW